MSGMPFLNSNYKLLSEVQFPIHDPNMDSELTTLYIFDITQEKSDDLFDIEDNYDSKTMEMTVMDDLDVSNDYNPTPGAKYFRYRVERPDAYIVFLYETVAYNV